MHLASDPALIHPAPPPAAPGSADAQRFDQGLAEAALAHQLATHRGNLPMVVGGTFLLTGVFWWLVGRHAPPAHLALWLTAVGLVQSLRIGLEWAHRRSPPDTHTSRGWLGRHRLLILLHGLAWVIACTMPLAVPPLQAEVLRVIILLVLVAGGFSLLAFDLTAALLFAVPVILSLCLRLLWVGADNSVLMACGLVAALVYLALAARRAGATLREHVRLKQVAQDQAAALSQHQALLAEQSATLSTTLEATGQGIAYLDRNGRLRVFNQRARDLLALPGDLVADGAHFQSVLAFQIARGDLPPEGYYDLQGQARPRPQPDAQGVLSFVRRTLQGGCLEVRIRQLPDGSQVRTYTDVTEAEQARRALTHARDEAERASQAKSQFLSGMSHELRTPLNAVQGFAELLLSDTDHPLHPSHRQPVAEVGRAAHHLRSLVEDLLDLSVLESGRMLVQRLPVPLLPIVDSALALVRPLAEQTRVSLPGTAAGAPAGAGAAVPQVWGDPTRLTQVLLNLLDNAVKYNRPGGAVRVQCELLAPDDQGHGARWCVQVEDDGPGLSPEHQARVFEPFERLSAARSAVPGAGLGLALSRRLVESMQGQIGVRSTPGGGACFWVALPVCAGEQRDDVLASGASGRGQDAAVPAAAAPAPSDSLSLQPLHDAPVLYVEDNPVNAALMEAMFRRLGLTGLVVAATGAEGLQQLAALQPQLVLLDIELPDTNGYDLLSRIREHPRWQAVPVLAVTANALPDDQARGLRAGFAQYLTKPVSLAQLQAALADVLQRRGQAAAVSAQASAAAQPQPQPQPQGLASPALTSSGLTLPK